MRGRELVARNLRRLRVTAGISQERLAADTGIDRAYLGGLERETGNPTVDFLDRLAASLNVRITAFFEDASPEDPRPKPLSGGRRSSQRRLEIK